MPGYANPVAHIENIVPERVDDGVDYRFSGGWLAAVADCVITDSAAGGWDPYGNYVEYRILEPGPLKGMYVYYAEGVQLDQHRGQIVRAGEKVCTLIPNWHYGIEIGWAAGSGRHSWAVGFGGGHHRTETTSTQAGISFNRLIERLGGRPGIVYHDVQGTAPNISYAGIQAGGGGGPVSVPTPQPIDVSKVDPSPIIRDAWWQFGQHGYRAYNNANFIALYFGHTSYCTEEGTH